MDFLYQHELIKYTHAEATNHQLKLWRQATKAGLYVTVKKVLRISNNT
jgi:hypothetical protein